MQKIKCLIHIRGLIKTYEWIVEEHLQLVIHFIITTASSMKKPVQILFFQSSITRKLRKLLQVILAIKRKALLNYNLTLMGMEYINIMRGDGQNKK